MASNKNKPKFHVKPNVNLSKKTNIIIIAAAIAGVLLLLFVIALLVNIRHEKRRKRDGKKARYGRAVFKAFTVPTFLFIPIFLYKKFCRGRKDKGAYAKIGDSNQHSTWYGAPLPHKQADQEMQDHHGYTMTAANSYGAAAAPGQGQYPYSPDQQYSSYPPSNNNNNNPAYGTDPYLTSPYNSNMAYGGPYGPSPATSPAPPPYPPHQPPPPQGYNAASLPMSPLPQQKMYGGPGTY